jgi:hypothetical protein
MSAIGFAIKQDGSINVRTVSPTMQAAKINWLIVERGVMIRASEPDHHIEIAWRHLSSESGATCVQVDITESVNPTGALQ